MIQLILHLIGDYVTQSDWMAQNKTKSTWAAFCHATVYSIPFAFIASGWALFVIWSTHLLIDRFRLARYVVWAKNFLAPKWLQCPMHNHPDPRICSRCHGALLRNYEWVDCDATGYPKDTPPWLAVWLMIAADNTIHLAINAASLAWL